MPPVSEMLVPTSFFVFFVYKIVINKKKTNAIIFFVYQKYRKNSDKKYKARILFFFQASPCLQAANLGLIGSCQNDSCQNDSRQHVRVRMVHVTWFRSEWFMSEWFHARMVHDLTTVAALARSPP